MVKKIKKRYIVGVIVVIVFVSLGGFIGNYFHDYALNIQVDKSKISNQDYDGIIDETFEENKQWFDAHRQTLTMRSVTHVDLVGHIFEHNTTSKWVIVTHGYTSRARNMANYIRKFYDMGYSVLAPDLIAHGESGGQTISMGSHDSKDMKNWIVKLSQQYHTPDIVLFGVSMGAATIMNTLDEQLPSNVKAFIEDSGYVHLKSEFTYQLQKLFKLPQFPVIQLADIVTRFKAGYSFDDVDATHALQNTTLPALILHGKADSFVPVSDAQQVYNLLSSPKEIYLFDDAKHVKAEKIFRSSYWQSIQSFLEKYFK